MEVPFGTFLIFSTNLQPESLGDEAFLRRIQYKMFLCNPVREEFVEALPELLRITKPGMPNGRPRCLYRKALRVDRAAATREM